MLALIREYSLDVWDWIVGNRYPRQEQLDWIKEPDPRFPAPYLKTDQIKMGGDLRAKTQLMGGANLRAETKLMCNETRLVKLVRQPSLAGLWESEAREWHHTHPASSVCITQLKHRGRVYPKYTSEHEEF